MLTFFLESHTHSITCTYSNFFYQHSLSYISWGIVLERYLNNDLLTYSCQVCSIVSNRNVRLWMRVRDMTYSVSKAYGLLCYMCTRFMYVNGRERKRDDEIVSLFCNIIIDPMRCSVIEFLRVNTSSLPFTVICYTFSCHAHFNFPKIYVVFNTYQYTISTLCAPHVRTIPF